jgi:small-conductance mechanosensitive channel
MQSILNNLYAGFIDLIPQFIVAIGLLAIFWICANFAKKIFYKIAKTSKAEKHDVFFLLGQTAKILLIIIGLITSLGTLGINVTALVTGLGLTGFALGFALKDALSNLLAGVLIMLYQPFRKGDYISAKNFEGTIVRIDLRYTTLRTEKERILVPNSEMFTNPIRVKEESNTEAMAEKPQVDTQPEKPHNTKLPG